jgi:hypothetical protein
MGCGSPHDIDKFVDEKCSLTSGKSAETVLDFRITNRNLHMSMAWKDRQKPMDEFPEKQFNRLDKNGDVFITLGFIFDCCVQESPFM